MKQSERERIIKKLSEGETPDKYYVYALCDPSTHLPFYIGKGEGGRVWQHEDGLTADLLESIEAEKADLSSDQEEKVRQEVAAKHKRIAELAYWMNLSNCSEDSVSKCSGYTLSSFLVTKHPFVPSVT